MYGILRSLITAVLAVVPVLSSLQMAVLPLHYVWLGIRVFLSVFGDGGEFVYHVYATPLYDIHDFLFQPLNQMCVCVRVCV